MKNKTLLTTTLLFTFLFFNKSFSQEFQIKDYTWDEKNTEYSISKEQEQENEVVLERNLKVEILVENSLTRQYYVFHDKTLVNSNESIEKHNKIYLPYGENEKILVNKARVILKNGKIINIDSANIKEEKDEEKGITYNYFAVNGLEKGAIIEKLFIFEEYPDLNGKSIKMQDEFPIENINFELIYPKHLVFKTKSYNGLSEPTIDDTKYKDKNVLSVSAKNIPALLDNEVNSNWISNLKLIRYKLDQNLLSGAKNLYNFKSFSSNVYDNVNIELDKKNVKAIDDFSKNIPKSAALQEQIWNIENKIKKTITYNNYFDNKQDLAEVIKTKQANQTEIIKLYVSLFKKFEIENQLVFTSSRYRIPFDKDFESYENLNDILFYFPTINKYLTPTEIEYRIPLYPASIGNNNGLFIKSKEYSGVKMGIGEISRIELIDTKETLDIMNITVDFSKDIENPIITTKIEFGGYSNLNFQPLKDYVPAEQYQSILKDIAKNYSSDADFKDLKTENDGIDNLGKKPFILDVTYEGKDLIQKAGTSYLFSIGQTIGKQMELYQESKRKFPLEIDYPHAYKRKIKIILPNNVTVKNLEKFNMNFETEVNGKTEAAFKSQFTQDKNIITVDNTEFYNITNYPVEKFESYRNVINAAADFNKIVIILNQN